MSARRLMTLLTVALATAMAPAAADAAPQFHDASGLHVLSQHSLDARLLALSVSTAALRGTPATNKAINGPANVRILLPSDYTAHPRRRYPVLYLLDGTSGAASDWTTAGGAEATTAGRELIVVMPDITLSNTGGGWCTNWVNGGRFGAPEWETFHIGQLIPWIDRNLRTVVNRGGRAIAGLSQGGFCAMSYPARHPDLFSTALSYSGAPDIAFDTAAIPESTAIINATELALDGVPANSMFGTRTADEVNWAAHDPATLAENLRGMNLLMYTGNGMPGPYDNGVAVGLGATIETLVHLDTILFHSRLQRLGIPSFFDDYGPGTHSWPYWARDLQQSIGKLMADFAHPPAAPSHVTFTAAEPRYSVYGWSVAMHRKAEEFSTLRNASATGFTLSGSGSGTVTTPPHLFTHNRRYTAHLIGQGINRTETLRPGRDGSLSVAVPLGPANPYQQYTALAVTKGTKVFATRVAITRAH